ncbi:MAG TPA: hypothetical protein VD996_07100 [Chitinophagaceae bacterium]|nr:hypothetical protein [Chitinophagaceae bacterium]
MNTVEFGKNRVQFKKFKWQYYQTDNFNTYFSENGMPLAKYVAQIAEQELPSIEQFVEYGLQRRGNIVIYNHFNDLEQSNIGLSLDWQTTGGITKLVNNKMIVYYNGDHKNLKRQVRQGIARVLVDNVLFGDDLGEFATNQALLDLPKWLVDGYVEFAAEPWSTELDDQLKSAMLSGRYKNFYQFAYEKPNLAGHSFWYYIAEKYKKENVTYFLYLARVYRNLNSASNRIAKKKFKEVLKDFMAEQEDKYAKDIRGRRNFPRGTVSVVEEVRPNKDFIRFTANPAPRSQTYAVVEYINGVNCVVLYENYINRRVLLKNGTRNKEGEINPNYPLLAWDGKGTRLAVVYWEKGKIKFFVYDVLRRYKTQKGELSQFEQIQSMQFMLDANTLLLSAVRKGQSDVFVYKLNNESVDQITNDIYDDLDASFVAFPNKTGIIFASNRPNATAVSADTSMPTDQYNIFLINNWANNDFRQVSQLTTLKFGDARFPTQYNGTHFTFVSDENGIGNRYAGFFSTERAGADTIVRVGDMFLRNPDPQELDSTLKAYDLAQPDSVFFVSVTTDSAYIFPLTNYQSSLIETKIAGDQGQVSEVRQEGDLKFLYKLRVDENALRRRNVNARPTDYRKKTMIQSQLASGEAIRLAPQPGTDTTGRNDFFESEFDRERRDSARTGRVMQTQDVEQETVLQKAKLFDYRLKFSVDNFSGTFNNDVLINRYEPFTGSLPISLTSSGGFNGMLKASVFDLMEDIRFTGAVRLPFFNGQGAGAQIGGGGVGVFIADNSALFDGGGEWYARADYLKKRIDYSAIYYRKTEVGNAQIGDGANDIVNAKMISNLYQGVLKYPFDKVRSVRLMFGLRTDKIVLRPLGISNLDTVVLKMGDFNKQTFGLLRMEYVHDNTVMKAMNILNGLRYKVFVDWNSQINKVSEQDGRFLFNAGFDARYYYPIYRNFVWAVRGAGDFSWGNRKVVYYLGGVDGWLFPKYNQFPVPQDQDYAYQSLAVNLRGFRQNTANGNNALVINSELRFPVFSTLFNKPINNAFLRNFQLVQFFDFGTAWNGTYSKIERPTVTYTGDNTNPTPATVVIKAGGVGPFAGGYGFGARSTLLGYFLRFDAGWQMNGFFRGKPILHVAMGVDF